ncbi:bifunctional metallophosphatase/5'-nucleotidase [Sphingomonas sp. HDW15A]|uniref:bifunctional metallophosphatase/5'-nucleotidase n=1 Tax=Sphingomonas sp. HDW15A TaxID=2714942 RepID=UPI001407F464|nr:bifunctional metallophosphatase/5'-nucleotidase [Sphingomonas sp. HDW15A]QIK96275.1 bifunctional metallophosphatase/5'-nucleotidase [Sphingomonas sp. HDW15A]
MRRLAAVLSLAFLASCSSLPTPPPTVPPPPPLEVQILAINDFHGNLEPPGLAYEGSKGKVPVGGAAYLATALREVRTPASITVAAGDLISASPLVSSLYYDEPTVRALSDSGLALAAVGNHEFDRGPAELKRMQAGGCREKQARETRQSCALEAFTGAGFQYLAANVLEGSNNLFPSTAIRDIGGVRIGFIGMTLKETGTLVSPDGVKGLAFLDEAGTANALVPYLKQNGAKAIVLLIHQGGATDGKFDDPSCPGLSGDIMPILAKLDPAIDLVVSGHTHQAYICQRPPNNGARRLLTSAGRYGALVTDIRLSFAPDGTLIDQRAEFVPVQGEPIDNARVQAPLNPAYRVFAADPGVASLVQRYKAAASVIADRPVGKLSAPLEKGSISGESQASEFIADGQLFVARNPAKGAADFGFMNNGGARTDLIPGPDGTVTYGQIFALQPFANNLVTISLTGAQVKAVLEQQFDSGTNTVARPNLIMPSANVRFSFDKSRPAGQRIVSILLDGRPIDPTRTYRVTVNNFLASGGDGFTALAAGTNPVDGGLDLDATEAYLKSSPPVPQKGRVIDLTPAGWTPPAS